MRTACCSAHDNKEIESWTSKHLSLNIDNKVNVNICISIIFYETEETQDMQQLQKQHKKQKNVSQQQLLFVCFWYQNNDKSSCLFIKPWQREKDREIRCRRLKLCVCVCVSAQWVSQRLSDSCLWMKSDSFSFPLELIVHSKIQTVSYVTVSVPFSRYSTRISSAFSISTTNTFQILVL